MARSEDQNRRARERAKEVILQAAIEVFEERGVSGASIAEITKRAGVAQGLVSYHFGGKDQLIAAVIDRWFITLLELPSVEGSPDEVLASIIDSVFQATAYAVPLQRVVLAIQQQPATHRLFAESEDRFSEQVTMAEDAVRNLFRARGAADPGLEEVMFRSVLEGVFVKYSVYRDTYPLEDARRWVRRLYDLPEPTVPLPLAVAPREGEPRPRARGGVCEGAGSED